MLTGRLAANGDVSSAAVRTLPTGLTFVSPPIVACYFEDGAAPGTWRDVTDFTSTADNIFACVLREVSIGGPLTVTMLAPSQYVGANYAIVVVF